MAGLQAEAEKQQVEQGQHHKRNMQKPRKSRAVYHSLIYNELAEREGPVFELQVVGVAISEDKLQVYGTGCTYTHRERQTITTKGQVSEKQ